MGTNYRIPSFLRGFLLLVIAFTASPVHAQNLVLQPPQKVNTDGTLSFTLLFKATRQVEVRWQQPLAAAGTRMLIGRQRGSYDVTAVPVSGSSHRFTPSALGMTTGRYYIRLSNASGTTFAELQADTRTDKILSNEVELIVESNQAPKVNTPRGQVTDPTPIFSWDPVPGVPAYWVILSSTPFEITTDADDQIKIQGANVVWQIITASTSSRFGEVNTKLGYYDIEAPPLNPGQEYSYAVLNVYEENNPVYASPVFGGIVPFRYENPNAIPKPALIAPAEGTQFDAAESITFRWSEVTQAVSYGVNLYQVVTQQGVDVTIPIWSASTTNTVIDYPAAGALKNARYQWNVIAFDAEGGGTTSGSSASPTSSFRYSIKNGAFYLNAASTADPNVDISGVEVSIRAISGGVTPTIPSFLQSTSLEDSLVVGTYVFSTKKTGFADTSFTVTIRERETSWVKAFLRPLPSFLTGLVADNRAVPVSGAIMRATSALNGSVSQVETDPSGIFRMPLNPGSYEIRAEKPGFIAPSARLVTLERGQAIALRDTFKLINDRATIAGAILNEAGGPIQNARVVATSGDKLFETRTDGTGVYALVLSSGVWNITSEKNGFVPGNGRRLTLTAGDQLQNQNLTMAGRANSISGFIREQILNADGTIGSAPRSQAVIQAIPSSGNAVQAVSNSNGQYVLSLGSGTYTLTVSYPGYTLLETPPQMVLGFGETYSGVNFSLRVNPSSITGVVRAPDASPISGAAVSAAGISPVTTNASGVYTLSLPAGNHEIQVSRSGYVSPRPRLVGLAAGQHLSGVDFGMSANAGTISGRVSSNGASVAQATITAVSAEFGTIQLQTSTSGEYVISLQPSTWTVTASKAGFVTSTPVSITLAAGQTRGATDFLLVSNVRVIRGLVTDGASPIRNVEIVFSGGGKTVSTVTQANGTYSASLEAGLAYSITARLTGYRTANLNLATVTPSETALQQNLVLAQNPASVAGTVADQNLKPLGGARILLIQSGASQASDSVLSSATGAFQLGLGAGSYTLRARLPGYLADEKPVTIDVGQAVTGIRFSLSEQFALISGVIRDGAGEPVDGALISITGADRQLRSAQTDRTGSYILSQLIPGSFTASVTKSGLNPVTGFALTLQPGEQRSRDFVLTASAGAISGLVTDAQNAPVAGAVVTAVEPDGDLLRGLTGANGTYSFTAIPFGTYQLSASKTGYSGGSSVQVTLSTSNANASGTNLTGLLANNGVIRGNITDLGDNSRLSGASIQVSGTTGSGSAVSSSTGSYSIQNLAPGRYTVITQLSGWEPDTTSAEITIGSTLVALDRQLVKNAGRLTGRVLTQTGAVMDFRPTLTLQSPTATYTSRADEAGNFVFDGIKTGVTYRLITTVYRDGYINASQNVTINRGAAEVRLSTPLVIEHRSAAVLGTAGRAGVTVSLLSTGANATAIGNFLSETDGTYRFRFLKEGSYRVVPKLAGFVFTPDTATVSLTFGEQKITTFTAVPNIGTIRIITQTGTTRLSNVQVTLASTDEAVVRNGATGTNGEITFSELPAGKTYQVRAQRTGYTTTPASVSITLTTGQTATEQFSLGANSGRLTGRVTEKGNGNGVSQAILRARQLATNEIYEQTSQTDGTFSIGNLPTGLFRLTARKSGFSIDTLFNIQVDPGAVVANNNLELERAAIGFLGGAVTFGGAPVSGVTVRAVSSEIFTATTGSDGFFFMNALPVRPGTGDTTLYTITVSTPEYTSSRILKFTAADIGQPVWMPTTKLPSGRVTASITDGVNPLPGVRVQFVRIGGTNSTTIFTGNDGLFQSSNRLRGAVYAIDVARSGSLLPEKPYTVELTTDTSVVAQVIRLPYALEPIAEIRADAASPVRVRFTAGYNPDVEAAELLYRKAGQTSYTAVNLTRDGQTLRGEIPALFTLDDITYYVRVAEQGNPNGWISQPVTLKPLASGLLTRIRMSPDLGDQILRLNDAYAVDFTLFDGVSQDLESKFTGTAPTGQLLVNSIDYQAGISIERSGLSAIFRPTRAGVFRFKIEGRLNGIVVTRDLSLTVTDAPVKEIAVVRPEERMVNTGTYTFTYAAFDSAKRRILLGSAKDWFVEPRQRGTMSADGVFTPASAGTIGQFTVGLRDRNTGMRGQSAPVQLYAVVQPAAGATLTDGQGMQLRLPAGSLTATAEFSFLRVTPEAVKKYVRPKGSDESYVVSDTLYRIVSTLNAVGPAAVMTIPYNTSLRHASNGFEMGWYDPAALEWRLLTPSGTAKHSGKAAGRESPPGTPEPLHGTGFRQFGLFGIMAKNGSLGIHSAAVLPTPFSPDVAPAKIGYILESLVPPAEVSIVIYNMQGEKVRTLLRNDLQFPGRYGSRTGLKEIVWDGRTDTGRMALNGRYIIEIKARDSRGETTRLLPVVLVK